MSTVDELRYLALRDQMRHPVTTADKRRLLAERVRNRLKAPLLRKLDSDDNAALSHVLVVTREVRSDGQISREDIEILAAAVEILRAARSNTP